MPSLLVVKPYEDRFLGVKASRKRGRWEFSAVKEWKASELKGRSVVALETTPRVYFSRETLNKGPKEVLLLQAEDKIRDSGYFTGAFQTAICKLSEGPVTVEAGILALEPQGVNHLIETLGRAQARLKAIHHQTVAMAFLAGFLSEEPVLVVWISPEGLWMTVSEAGGLTYLRFQEVDEFLGLEGHPIEESILAVLDYYERFFGKTIRKILPCGPKREAVPRVETLEPLSPDLNRLIKAPEEELLTYPELFGAVFVPEGYNLLPETHKFFLKNLEWVRWSGGILFILALLNYGLWAYFYQKNHTLEAEIFRTRKTLENKLSILNKNYPLSQVKNLKEYLSLKESFEKQPRLDEFLWWLANNLPQRIKVRSLETSKKGQNYELGLRLFFEGDLASARRGFLTFFDKIKTRAEILDTRFNYDEMAQRADFELKVRLK
ncbi:MAG TPA: hypothetical protein EYP81_00485 [Thermodesulfobacteriaceae bacterium]|nr:hypothetical protein [Thermodesulfobacteriaceae bacterium]